MGVYLDGFHSYFDVIHAADERLKTDVYSLRYQVYCLETGFENPDQFPDGLEKDHYDGHSVHCLLRHKPSDSYAGTVRLILPYPSDDSRPFPIELHAGKFFDPAKFNPEKIPRSHLAEISRLALTRNFHRRQGEEHLPAGRGDVENHIQSESDRRRNFPHVILGLFVAIVQMSVQQGITHWYAVMEPALARLLQRFGIQFTEIGPVIDYHGLRQPFFGAVDEVMAGIYATHPNIWNLLTNDGRLMQAPKDDA